MSFLDGYGPGGGDWPTQEAKPRPKVRVNVFAMDDGYDHAVCYFCGWHSIGFKVGHPQHGDLTEWAKLHAETCPFRLKGRGDPVLDPEDACPTCGHGQAAAWHQEGGDGIVECSFGTKGSMKP